MHAAEPFLPLFSRYLENSATAGSNRNCTVTMYWASTSSGNWYAEPVGAGGVADCRHVCTATASSVLSASILSSSKVESVLMCARKSSAAAHAGRWSRRTDSCLRPGSDSTTARAADQDSLEVEGLAEGVALRAQSSSVMSASRSMFPRMFWIASSYSQLSLLSVLSRCALASCEPPRQA
jgi:hypothetical protein